MIEGINNVIRIPSSVKDRFFLYWFEFLKPFHHLTNREMQLAAALVKKRYELSKVIHDDNILDKVVMSEDSQRDIRKECNLSLSHYQCLMSKLKKSKIINEGKINSRFIPNLTKDKGSFRMLLNFELD